jgi:hypothetical protein
VNKENSNISFLLEHVPQGTEIMLSKLGSKLRPCTGEDAGQCGTACGLHLKKAEMSFTWENKRA